MSQSGSINGLASNMNDLLGFKDGTGTIILPDGNGTINVIGDNLIETNKTGTSTLQVSLPFQTHFNFQIIDDNIEVQLYDIPQNSSHLFIFEIVCKDSINKEWMINQKVHNVVRRDSGPVKVPHRISAFDYRNETVVDGSVFNSDPSTELNVQLFESLNQVIVFFTGISGETSEWDVLITRISREA